MLADRDTHTHTLEDELIAGSLGEVREALARDPQFAALAHGDIEAPDDATDPSLLIGAPQGIRPALAAATAERAPVVVVVPSGREAEELVEDIRSWYRGDPAAVAQLQSWETLPHERLSPRADTVANRMEVFRRLCHPRQGSAMFGPIRILVMPVRSLIQPVVAGIGDVVPLVFTRGEEMPLDTAAQQLVRNAYTRVDLVMDRGEFAVRGGLIDVFPPTAPHPVRIEFFGDEIDSIRQFHASDQRTYGDEIDSIWATPCREVQLTSEIRDRARALVGSIPNADDMLESIAQAIPVEGMESLIPALIDEMQPVSSMLPLGSVVMLSDPEKLRRAVDDLEKTANEFLATSWSVAASGHGSGAPITFDQANFLNYQEAVAQLMYSEREVWQVSGFTVDTTRPGHVQIAAQTPVDFRGSEAKAEQGLRELLDDGYELTLTAAAHGTLQRLKRMLHGIGVARFTCVRSQAQDGFIDTAARVALLTERDVTGRASAAGASRTPRKRHKSIDLMELKPGDFVVHEQHGVGRFVEMRQRTTGTGRNQSTREYLVIEYAPSKRNAPPDKLFIPTDQLDQVSKYIGAEIPELNKLGGSDWAQTKAKAKKHVHEIAQNLIKLYAARQQAKGFAFSKDTPWQKELEDAFPYQETADQLTTIDDVKADMEKPVPMDRLICGDVGFGKTEVALRAAFKAAQDGKQVMVLCPTTILAQQHYTSFKDRFDPFDVTVEVLSRFRTPEQQKAALEGFAKGDVQVLVGTHRLLSRDVNPHDLGLVIIDEEQRFGVQHKEQLKNLRESIDVLTLSATPIPRTMQMSLSGVRDMSLILTPPDERRPVEVHVGEWDPDVVSAAIRYELARGGQVYYVSNRVRSIDEAVDRVHAAAGEARVGVAHGQMTKEELEQVMEEFAAGELDVLVATTIIESGIDNPHTNTLIIEDSQRLGLAQLYQLKGRVGRGRTQAFAYFLFDGDKPLTEEATERLTAINEYQDLGSGMRVAMRDLEIRGAGSLVGAEQHGNLQQVGFDLFTQMLGAAVSEARGEVGDVEPSEVTVNLSADFYFDDEFIPEIDKRVMAYRRVAAATELEQVDRLETDLAREHGTLPEPARNLLDRQRIRIRAERLGVTSVALTGGRLVFLGHSPDRDATRELKAKGALVYPKTAKVAYPHRAGDDVVASTLSVLEVLGGDDEE